MSLYRVENIEMVFAEGANCSDDVALDRVCGWTMITGGGQDVGGMEFWEEFSDRVVATIMNYFTN
jgi:hypothetical protein